MILTIASSSTCLGSCKADEATYSFRSHISYQATFWQIVLAFMSHPFGQSAALQPDTTCITLLQKQLAALVTKQNCFRAMCLFHFNTPYTKGMDHSDNQNTGIHTFLVATKASATRLFLPPMVATIRSPSPQFSIAKCGQFNISEEILTKLPHLTSTNYC